MRRISSLVVLVLMMSVICVLPVNAAKEVKIQHNLSIQHPWHKGLTYVKEQVEMKTNGNIKMTIYPSGILADQDWANILQQTQRNIVQMTVESTIPFATLVPEFFAFNTPFMFEDMDHLLRFLDRTPDVVNNWFQKLEGFDLEVLAVWPRAPRQLLNSKRPITTPEDIEGMKFRVPGLPLFIKVFEALGAKPVPLPTAEIYTAMQLGTVDGEDNSVGHVFDTKTCEVGKYMNIWNYMADPIIVVANKTWFDSLTADEQAIVLQATKDARDIIYKAEIEAQEHGIREMEKSGIEFTYFDDQMKQPFIEKMGPVYNEIKKLIGEEAWEEFQEISRQTK